MILLENSFPTAYVPSTLLEVGDQFQLNADGLGWREVSLIDVTGARVIYGGDFGVGYIILSDDFLVLKRLHSGIIVSLEEAVLGKMTYNYGGTPKPVSRG